ncbi:MULTISPECIES: porin [unclassified Paraburkholderia]|uniref:porin n=1 Tax=unclassified Paraburkholderia TaxID=2615204 RepID=UPI0016129266|nr:MULTISPECIES: porin [unclassified Paraburkholderia]MBB5411056.1 putative porin [Paraburkholderia sp. HC6.4b]MBB5453827.1 putative porin [Paraburkholderia sp. Kb1A]
MRKLITCGAIAAAAFAPMMAQAQQSSVTLYGVADVFMGYFANSNGQHVISMNSGGAGGSRWGLRGQEDLGNGLSAIFTLESGFNINNGTSGQSGRLFGRRAFVGLHSAQYGELIAGRLQTMGYDWGGTFDPILLAPGSPLGSIGGENPRPWLFNMLQDPARSDNSIQYTSPTFRGLTGTLTYSWGDPSDPLTAQAYQRHFELATLRYENGPLITEYGFGHSLQNQAAVARNTYENVLGIRYNLNFMELYASGQIRTNDPGFVDKGWQVGFTVPTSPFGTVRVSYGELSDQNLTASGTQITTPVKVGDWFIRSAAIGYTYSVSKSTMLYGFVKKLWNSGIASQSIYPPGGLATTGQHSNVTAIGLGMSTRF